MQRSKVTASGVGEHGCFARLARAIIVGDTLSVFTNDSGVIFGRHPIVNLTASVLYMRSASESGGVGYNVIPFETINRITYRKPSGVRHVPTVLGLVVGAAAWITVVDLSERGSLSEGSYPLEIVFFGGMIGGIVGVVLGNEIGKRMTSAVTLECR